MRFDSAKLLGAFRETDARGFRVAAFSSEAQILIQELDSAGRISNFRLIDDYPPIFLSRPIAVQIGSPAIFAYDFGDEQLEVGTATELRPVLLDDLPHLLDSPFALLEVASFLGESGLLRVARESAMRKFGEGAERWIRHSDLSPEGLGAAAPGEESGASAGSDSRLSPETLAGRARRRRGSISTSLYEGFTYSFQQLGARELRTPDGVVNRETLAEATRRFEREYVSSTLKDLDWDVPRVARLLGIKRAYLYALIRAYSLDDRSRKSD